MNDQEKIEAGREMLAATKRSLQLVDEQIALLQDDGRVAVSNADDVSSEHRVAWFGAVDDADQQPGILMNARGFQNTQTGVIRIQEDAAFVCTDVLVAFSGADLQSFFESEWQQETAAFKVEPYLRLIDANTGRHLVTGMTTGPLDRDHGSIPFSYLSSLRNGLGPNVKNKLFSEFTIPRSGVVRVEVNDMAPISAEQGQKVRFFVTLLGYKVYGA